MKMSKKMKITKIEITRPECKEYCYNTNCKYCEEIDESFDHEFGTERRISYECHYDFIKYNGYGDCPIVTEFIDDEIPVTDSLVNIEVE